MVKRATFRRSTALGALALMVALARPAGAQPRPVMPRPPPPPRHLTIGGHDEPAAEFPGGVSAAQASLPSLRERFGVARGEDLISSPHPKERMRGIARLATAGSEEAVEVLVESLGREHPVRLDARTRLAAVRALAEHSALEEVQRVLSGVLSDGPSRPPEKPLDRLARETAALALARQGGRDALVPLYSAVIGAGPNGEIAREALLAYPPENVLEPLGKKLDELSPVILRLLGDLGDPRVLGLLRKQLTRDDEEAVQAAALALATLGDDHAMAKAEEWAGSDEAPAQLLAAKIYARLDAPQGPQLIAKLLGKAATRSAALELAAWVRWPALVPTLAAILGAEVTDAERQRAVAILAQMGDEQSARVLLGTLSNPQLATRAALALAQSDAITAQVGLVRALRSAAPGPARRHAQRAAIVWSLTHGATLEGVEASLQGALSAEDARDRAVGAFGAVALGLRDPAALVRGEPALARAAARGALALGPRGLAALIPLLSRTDDPSLQAAGAPALLVSTGGLSPLVLALEAERGGAWAALAAYRLASLDPAPLRPRVVRLLEARDPLVRRHVALGLGRSPEPDAVSLLVEAYQLETVPAVRRAILRALSLRSERQRQVVLELAAGLDPDPEARALAKSALGGLRLAPALPSGPRVAWVTLRPSAERIEVGGWPAVVVPHGGLGLVATSAPDGVLLVPGLGLLGQSELRVVERAALPTKLPQRSEQASEEGAGGEAPPEKIPDDLPDDRDLGPADLAPEDDTDNSADNGSPEG